MYLYKELGSKLNYCGDAWIKKKVVNISERILVQVSSINVMFPIHVLEHTKEDGLVLLCTVFWISKWSEYDKGSLTLMLDINITHYFHCSPPALLPYNICTNLMTKD